jgi:hypothetical protein
VEPLQKDKKAARMLAQRYVWLQDVARQAPWRMWAALGLPHDAQRMWLAAAAFDFQLESVRTRTHEAMIGHMRFAWWRELLGEVEAGGAIRPHPLAEPLRQLATNCEHALLLLNALLESRYEAFAAEEEQRLDAMDKQSAAAHLRLLELAACITNVALSPTQQACLEALSAWIAGAERLQALAATRPDAAQHEALAMQALADATESNRYWSEQSAAVGQLPKPIRRFSRMQAIIAADIYAQVVARKGQIFDAPLGYRQVRVPLKLLFAR